MKIQRIVVLASCLALLSLGGCGSPEEKKANYLSLAEEYFQEGNFPKARVALRNVLKIDPKDDQGWFLLGQVEEKEKNWRKAFQHYLRVVELEATHKKALLRLGKFYLEGRAFDKVLEVTNQVLANDPENVSAQTLQTAVLALQDQVDHALPKAEKIVAQYPSEPDSAILLATLYRSKNRLVEARNVLQTALQSNPEHIELLKNLASTAIQLKAFPSAEIAMQRIVEIEPTIFDHHVGLAVFYKELGEFEKAKNILSHAITLDPDDGNRRLVLAELFVTQQNFQEAETTLLQAKQDLPHAMAIQFSLGKFYELQKEPHQARKIYQAIIDDQDTKPSGLEAQVKLAILDLQDGLKDQAVERLNLVLKENPRASDALMVKSQLALADKDNTTAIQSLRTVLKDQPRLSRAHGLLGHAYLLAGEISLSRESLEQAIKFDPQNFEAHRLLANLDAREGQSEKSQARLSAILEKQPNDLQSLAMLLTLQAANQEWSKTDQTVGLLKEAGANQYSVDMAKGNLLLTQKEWGQAQHVFEEIVREHPDEPAPLFGLVQAETNLGGSSQAQSRLETTIAHHPDNPYAHGMLGEILVLQRQVSAAEQEFQKAYTLQPKWVTPWLNHASLTYAQKKTPEAIAILESGLNANPHSQELRMLLATILTGTDKADLAIQEYETILKHNPKALLAANNLANLLTDVKGDPKSLERALHLTKEFETTEQHPFFLDTRGWIYHKMGRDEEAVRIIQRAVAQVPDHPVLNYHLGMAYYQLGNPQEARTYLSKAVEAQKDFEGAKEALSILKRIQG